MKKLIMATRFLNIGGFKFEVQQPLVPYYFGYEELPVMNASLQLSR